MFHAYMYAVLANKRINSIFHFLC